MYPRSLLLFNSSREVLRFSGISISRKSIKRKRVNVNYVLFLPSVVRAKFRLLASQRVHYRSVRLSAVVVYPVLQTSLKVKEKEDCEPVFQIYHFAFIISLPNALHAIRIKCRITTDNGDIFCYCLSDDYSIEWVAVVER